MKTTSMHVALESQSCRHGARLGCLLAAVLLAYWVPAQANPLPDVRKMADKVAGMTSGNQERDIENVLKTVPAELEALKQSQFKKVAQHVKAYQATGTLFGQTATVYLYWPDPQKINEPVIAVTPPDKLTADKLFGVGSALDVGLNQPAVFWLKNGGTLVKDAMPAELKQRLAAAGMPGAVMTAAGFNLFGQFASGFVADLLKPAPINLNPDKLFAGVAKGKEGYAVSLSIGAGTAWNNPFGLADTKIKGGTVRVTGSGGTKTVEAWGTANVKAKKDFTLYAKREGVAEQSLGFDIKDASLDDFFLVLGVAGKTLKLPAIPVPTQLPLGMVTLENPAYQPYQDASAPLVFDTMMFKGTQQATGVGELIANAKGKVFKQPVAALKLNASGSGVKGDAEVAAALGELKAASARFYLDVALSGTPSMGIKASTVLGSLDLKASTAGLLLDVPPQCPVQPLGLKATLTDISPKDLPLKFYAKDCATQVVKDVANAAIEGGKIVTKAAGKAAEGTGNAIVDGGKAVGGAVVDGGKTVGGAVGGAGKAIGGGIKKLF